MMLRSLAALAACVLFASVADAGPLRNRLRARAQPCNVQSTYERSLSVTPSGAATLTTTATTTVSVPGDDAGALAEVNAKRAARGLRPLIHDPALTEGAQRVAAFRAERSLFGHTANDFAFLPFGARASSAGCAAYQSSYGWMSCCVYDNATFGGAAWVMGRDGKRYMHLFIR